MTINPIVADDFASFFNLILTSDVPVCLTFSKVFFCEHRIARNDTSRLKGNNRSPEEQLAEGMNIIHLKLQATITDVFAIAIGFIYTNTSFVWSFFNVPSWLEIYVA